MMNKDLRLPLIMLKLKTALAIKTGIALFGLGFGTRYLLHSSTDERRSKLGTFGDGVEVDPNKSLTKKSKTRKKTIKSKM